MIGYFLTKENNLQAESHNITLRLPFFIHEMVADKTKGSKKRAVESLCRFAIDILDGKEVKAKKHGYSKIFFDLNGFGDVIYTGKKKQKTIEFLDDIKKDIEKTVDADCFTTKIVVLCYIALHELKRRNSIIITH